MNSAVSLTHCILVALQLPLIFEFSRFLFKGTRDSCATRQYSVVMQVLEYTDLMVVVVLLVEDIDFCTPLDRWFTHKNSSPLPRNAK